MAMRKTIPGLLVVFAACGGTGEIVVVDDPDAGQNDTGVIVVDAGTPDTGVVNPNQPPNTVKLSGKTLRLDAFLSSSDVPVAGTAINAQGAVGVAPVNSNALGDYEIYVPRDGQLILSASTPGPYLQRATKRSPSAPSTSNATSTSRTSRTSRGSTRPSVSISIKPSRATRRMSARATTRW
ncbi:MAG: hypothetical protein AAF449_04485 [Myxococcota bacterium]